MTNASPPESQVAQERRELEDLRAQTREAREMLEALRAELAQAVCASEARQESSLVDVNQQLVLCILRALAEAEAMARAAEEANRTARERELAEKDRNALLNEANAQLVVAAIDAQELQAAAERARKRQTDLLAVVAHELRHPLAPIRNAAAILGHLPERPPVLDRLQGIIEEQVLHMSRLVSDLLDAASATTGKLRIERRRIDIAPIIDAAVEGSRPAMQGRAQQFTAATPHACVMVDGDPVRLMQVLNNLLDNASKYTPNGGEIRMTTALEGDVLEIAVSDTGIGITPEALPHVFDPFVQDLHATAFNGVGLGLGLTVVRELVEGHGGQVVAMSDGAGLGSRFVVTLPLADAAAPN